MGELQLMIFVAVPYSNPDKSIEDRRYEILNEYLSYLFSNGLHAIAPVAIGHPLTKGNVWPLPGDYEFWREYSRKLVAMCDEVHVLALDGCLQSIGVKDETYYAHFDLKIPVKYIEPTRYRNDEITGFIDITKEISG
jgi:hypothetical protein